MLIFKFQVDLGSEKDAFDIEVSKTFRVLSSDVPVNRRNNSAMNQKHIFC